LSPLIDQLLAAAGPIHDSFLLFEFPTAKWLHKCCRPENYYNTSSKMCGMTQISPAAAVTLTAAATPLAAAVTLTAAAATRWQQREYCKRQQLRLQQRES
jgi:hypothetical protein